MKIIETKDHKEAAKIQAETSIAPEMYLLKEERKWLFKFSIPEVQEQPKEEVKEVERPEKIPVYKLGKKR